METNIGKLESSHKKSCYSIPDKITLSWSDLTIRTQMSPKKKYLLNVCSEVKAYETILNKVKGIVEPGEMLALMGSSGSGKTTLLNALNYSISDTLMVEGRIMLNGCEANPIKMSMVSCYIQQDDLFFGTLTVQEHLIFQAMLRMDKDLSRKSKMKRVNQVLQEFNLDRSAHVKIGIPGRIKGISGGEKRRLAFASEILTDPPILFCDEPTSGLDSKMAKSIVYYLKKLTNRGKTIICTIHQPSSETFAIFDKICLLSQTKMAFFGTREEGLNFFEEKLHLKCPPLTNPADFYMDKLGVDVNDITNSRAEIHSYCDKYAISEYSLDLRGKIDSVKPEHFSSPANYTSYKSSWVEQMTYLLQRSFFNYIRNRKVVLNDILMVFVTAILGGSIYYQTGQSNSLKDCKFNQQSIQNVSFALFYTITVSVIFSMLAAVMAFPNEIPIYYREHKSAVYRSDTYYLSKFLVELPVYLILPTIHSIVIYYMVGFDCDKNSFSVFLLTDILISNAAFSLGHILSVSTSDANFAISLTSPLIAIQMLFSGFFLRRAVRTPKFLSYIKYGSIFNYGYDLLMLNQWENVSEIECEYDIELLCLTTGGSVLNEEKIRRKLLFNKMNHKPNKITRQKMNRTLSAPSCPRTILDSYSRASEHSQQNLAISLTNSDTANGNQGFEMSLNCGNYHDLNTNSFFKQAEKTDRNQVFKVLQCIECEKIEIEKFFSASTSKTNLDLHSESIHEILLPKKKRKLGEENLIKTDTILLFFIIFVNFFYSNQKNKLLNILKSIHFISLTNDSWKSCQNYTYLSITGHYLENFAFRSFALGFKCMTERHRAEDIKEIVFEIVNEYGIKKKFMELLQITTVAFATSLYF